MDRLELMVKDSLEARARDVEPTPQLWREVERRAHRGVWVHRATVAGAAVAAAAAVAVAILVVPGLLRTGPQPGPEILNTPTGTQTTPVSSPAMATAAPRAAPTPAPTAAEPQPGGTSPGAGPAPAAPVGDVHVSGNDGQITLTDPRTGAVTELVDYSSPEYHGTVVAVAVRPGSTTDDLTVVFLHQDEGLYDLRHVGIAGGQLAPPAIFPVQYQVTNAVPAGEGAIATPVWAPGGDYVAWAETGVDGSTRLRVIGWDGGPGTGDPASDNTEFGVDQRPLSAVGWTWTETSDVGTSGTIALAVVGGDGATVEFGVTRQPDGAITETG